MPFLREFFQRLFDGNNQHHDAGSNDHHQFRDPIWRNDEEEDEYGDDYRHFGGNKPDFHFQIFSNPIEITRYFESQMEHMMKDFFSFGFDHEPSIDVHRSQMLPEPELSEKKLRDKVLKPGYEIPPPNYGTSIPKVDEDLDGQVTADDFSQVWKQPIISNNPQHQRTDHWGQPGYRSFGRSIITQTIRLSDGTIEERRTVTDAEGNRETTIKRQKGDQAHTIVTKTDKNGVETKSENNNWPTMEQPKTETGLLSQFPWHKFFGSSPKL